MVPDWLSDVMINVLLTVAVGAVLPLFSVAVGVVFNSLVDSNVL